MKCGSCFRCKEVWKDAVAKGFKPQEPLAASLYSAKPRRGIKVICTNLQNDNEITPKSQACKYFKHRTVWNAHLLIGEIKARARRVFDVCIRAPIGGLRKPVRLVWTDDYNFATDSIIRNAIPECPHCGEMAYNTKRCVFCGQRFIQDEHTAEWNKPSEIIKMNCPHCGGKNTLVGARSKINGHFHGECEKCGCRIME